MPMNQEMRTPGYSKGRSTMVTPDRPILIINPRLPKSAGQEMAESDVATQSNNNNMSLAFRQAARVSHSIPVNNMRWNSNQCIVLRG